MAEQQRNHGNDVSCSKELLTKLEIVFILYIFVIVACCGRAAVTIALMMSCSKVQLVPAYYTHTGIGAYVHLYMHGLELKYHPHKHEAQKHAKISSCQNIT